VTAWYSRILGVDSSRKKASWWRNVAHNPSGVRSRPSPPLHSCGKLL
jgi:hypothetical protein